MNRDWVLLHLREAREQLDSTIKQIEAEACYSHEEYQVEMAHAYHHMNTAWNSQNATQLEAGECTESNFERWRQFPTDIDLYV